jgi:hypothetical protein
VRLRGRPGVLKQRLWSGAPGPLKIPDYIDRRKFELTLLKIRDNIRTDYQPCEGVCRVGSAPRGALLDISIHMRGGAGGKVSYPSSETKWGGWCNPRVVSLVAAVVLSADERRAGLPGTRNDLAAFLVVHYFARRCKFSRPATGAQLFA